MARSEADPPTPEEELPEEEPAKKSSGSSGCLKAFVIICLAVIASLTTLAIWVGATVKELFTNPAGIVRTFLKHRTGMNADAILLEIKRTYGDNLEVASPTRSMESIPLRDTRYFGPLYLGTTVTEIRVPTEYRFHIKLSEIRDARLKGKEFTITVPKPVPVRPSIDTGKLEKWTDEGWARFNAGEQLAKNEQTVTEELEKRAVERVEYIRETARKDAAEFVRKWIVERDFGDTVDSIRVVFPDEDPDKVKAAPVTKTPEPLP